MNVKIKRNFRNDTQRTIIYQKEQKKFRQLRHKLYFKFKFNYN